MGMESVLAEVLFHTNPILQYVHTAQKYLVINICTFCFENDWLLELLNLKMTVWPI
jgi:hypothetical protein